MATEERPGSHPTPEDSSPPSKQDGEGGLLERLNDFPNPAGDGSMTPSDEEAWEDFEREGEELRGERPPPYKTWGFWLSALSTVLIYVVMSQLIPAGSTVYMAIVAAIALLGFFGYARYAEPLSNAEPDPSGRPNWQRPGFILSFVSASTSYVLGAGLGATSPIATTAIQIAQVLGYIGINIRPWRRRRGMLDPQEEPLNFGMRLLQLLLSLVSLFRRRK